MYMYYKYCTSVFHPCNSGCNYNYCVMCFQEFRSASCTSLPSSSWVTTSTRSAPSQLASPSAAAASAPSSSRLSVRALTSPPHSYCANHELIKFKRRSCRKWSLFALSATFRLMLQERLVRSFTLCGLNPPSKGYSNLCS